MPKDNEGPKPPPKSKKKKKLIPTAPKAPTIGDKAHAGRLLSECMRRISQEKTELVESPEGETLTSKGEALVRQMWRIALGYTEFDVKSGKDVVYKPSAGMIALIWDRMEGRAPAANENLDKKRTLPKKVSAENKKRLNSLAQGDSNVN